MRGNKLLISIVLVTCLVVACSSPGGGGPPAATPPSAMTGTVALGSQSAVITLSIGAARSVGAATVLARAIYNVGGKVRFQGQDFIITGQYDDVATAISGTTSTVVIGTQSIYFKFLGVYSDNTFRGSVEEYINGALAANGSVSAVPTTTSSGVAITVRTFTGTASGTGPVNGTWNMTLSGSTIDGTYSVATPGGPSNGVFSGSVSGTKITVSRIYSTTDFNTPNGGSANGTISGTFVSGTWAVGESRGIWNGKETTAAGDTTPPAVTDPIANQCTYIYQAITALTGSVDFSGAGPTFQNADGTVTVNATAGAGTDLNMAFTVANYVDPTYGVTVNGSLTEVTSAPPASTVQSVVGNLTFDWTGASISLGITSVQMNFTINNTARTMSGTVYYNGLTTPNLLSYVQTLMYP